MSESVGKFFGDISSEYDKSILTAIPPYAEFLEALLQALMLGSDIDPQYDSYFLPDKNTGSTLKTAQQPLLVLELGCGTGNVSVLLAKKLPYARLTLVDLSPEMLAKAQQKLIPLAREATLVQQGFMDLSFDAAQFDFVVASQSLHHLTDAEKPVFYRRIYQWLKPGGRFVCADDVLSLPVVPAYRLDTQRWIAWAKEKGGTDDEIRLWWDHVEKYDHAAPLYTHFQWLHDAGFQDLDCYWKKLFWAVFGGQKP